MRLNKYNKWLLVLAMSAVMAFGLNGCGKEKAEVKKNEAVTETVQETTEPVETEEKVEIPEEKDALEAALEEAAKENESKAEETSTEEIEPDKMLEKYYEEVLLEKEGLIELPSGYEVSIKERHLEGYSIGEAYLKEYGICYHAVWDYDKDEQDEMLVLLMDEDEDYERSKMYAKMYEVIDGEVVKTAELESLFGWMEFDTRQSMEVLLRETKDWFYLAEEARGYSSIYADGSCYAIRVAHYDGNDFVVDLAKQISGSDFSDTKEAVADTARLLTYVGFDHTAESLTYEYSFNKKDDLLSVFYMTAEVSGSLDKYYETMNITDVPPYMIRLFKEKE